MGEFWYLVINSRNVHQLWPLEHAWAKLTGPRPSATGPRGGGYSFIPLPLHSLSFPLSHARTHARRHAPAHKRTHARTQTRGVGGAGKDPGGANGNGQVARATGTGGPQSFFGFDGPVGTARRSPRGAADSQASGPLFLAHSPPRWNAARSDSLRRPAAACAGGLRRFAPGTVSPSVGAADLRRSALGAVSCRSARRHGCRSAQRRGWR